MERPKSSSLFTEEVSVNFSSSSIQSFSAIGPAPGEGSGGEGGGAAVEVSCAGCSSIYWVAQRGHSGE